MTTFDAKFDMYPAGDVGIVEGEMNVPSRGGGPSSDNMEFNTLDEPIKETFLRDLRAVGNKFYHVLIPREKTSLLKEWDLWGPLLLCTLMATVLQGAGGDGVSADGGPEFAEVFVLVWVGAAVVTLNSKLLGGNMSFFQSVCVLGYCLLPVAMSLVLCRLLLLSTQTSFLFFLRLVVSMLGFCWATFAATKFLGDSQAAGRKALAMYPIGLFYFILSWLVVSRSNV